MLLDISNLDKKLQTAVKFASELTTAWNSSDNSSREIFQNLVFPEGIYYDRKKHEFRTPKVNYIFELIARQSSNLDENGKATSHLFDDLSPSAERKGLPPLRSGDPRGGGFNQNEYPLATAHSHFCFPHPLRAGLARLLKQKCPGKAVGIHFNWRGERDKFRTFLGKI